jgi:flagellar basal-body rod modification protein FlgD
MTLSATSRIPSGAAASNAAAASTSGATAPKASATPTLSYDSFISLLIAELKNQDPTQPMDPSQMVSQLATVSEVGQSVQTNTSLSSLLTTASLTQAEQLVGKSITSADGATSGRVASVTVNGSSATATLSNGQQIPLANGVTVSSP